MKIIKNIALYLLFLVALCVCGTVVLKIFDLIMNLNYDHIWLSGIKVGFIAWIGLLINQCYHWMKEKKNR